MATKRTKEDKEKKGAEHQAFKAKIEAEVIARISLGEPLAQILRDEGMPGRSTFYDWMTADPEMAGRFARAREIGEDAIADDCLRIADDAKNDYMESIPDEGQTAGWKFNGEHVQRSKLRIETRLKLLAKWNPKKYGDKTQHEHTGKVSLEQLIAGDE